ncbi:hypothetical protein [Methanosphaera sp.]
MNQEEYENKVQKLAAENTPSTPRVETGETDGIKMQHGDPKNKEIIKNLINKYDDKIPMHGSKSNEEEHKKTDKTLSQIRTENAEELPDISEFLNTPEYIRMGDKVTTPVPVKIKGITYKIYIRPLNSNEYYQLQLKQLNEKKSLNYLAAITTCVDGQGNKLPQKFWDNLGFEIVETIGEAISILSGGAPDEKIQNAISKLLED